MKERADSAGIIFRPHFKTHQSAQIGAWFREAGVEKITVSSVEMAQYFSQHGWYDITIAFPYNPLEASAIDLLARDIKLGILIESEGALAHAAKHLSSPIHYWIKIDVGTGRTGIDERHFEMLSKLRKSSNSNHHCAGVLAHAGHTYQQLDMNSVRKIFEESLRLLNAAREMIGGDILLSYGDTPTCSFLTDWTGVDEMRPGNFVFYDTMQYDFGSCSVENIAVCMVCPVVAIHQDRNEAVIYGGAVHFSKDFIDREEGKYGILVKLTDNTWEKQPSGGLIRLSQEHGIISGDPDYIRSLRIGDLVGILPIHSCLTADLQGSYLSLSGNVIAKMTKV